MFPHVMGTIARLAADETSRIESEMTSSALKEMQ